MRVGLLAAAAGVATIGVAAVLTARRSRRRIKISKLTRSGFGALATGVDVTALDAESWAALHEAFLSHGGLCAGLSRRTAPPSQT